MYIPRPRSETNFVAIRDTIHDGVAYLKADDVPYDVPIDFSDDGAFFRSHNESSFFLPNRNAP